VSEVDAAALTTAAADDAGYIGIRTVPVAARQGEIPWMARHGPDGKGCNIDDLAVSGHVQWGVPAAEFAQRQDARHQLHLLVRALFVAGLVAVDADLGPVVIDGHEAVPDASPARA
jgi:hypothetical protein